MEKVHTNIHVRQGEISKRAYELWLEFGSNGRNFNQDALRSVVNQDPTPASAVEKMVLYQLLVDNAFHHGPLSVYMRDTRVNEIRAFSDGRIDVYTVDNVRQKAAQRFENYDHLLTVIERLFMLTRDELNGVVETRTDGCWIIASKDARDKSSPNLIIVREKDCGLRQETEAHTR